MTANAEVYEALKASLKIRSGCNRDKLLIRLMANDEENPVALSELQAAVYEAQNKNKGPIMMVLKGLKAMIEKAKVPYSIVKSKNDQKELCFALIHIKS